MCLMRYNKRKKKDYWKQDSFMRMQRIKRRYKSRSMVGLLLTESFILLTLESIKHGRVNILEQYRNGKIDLKINEEPGDVTTCKMGIHSAS